MPKIIFPAIVVFLFCSAGPGNACTLPSNVGASFNDIVKRATTVSYVQVVSKLMIIDRKKSGIGIVELSLIRDLKGTSAPKVTIVSGIQEGKSLDGFYQTNWFGCIHYFNYEIGKKYILSPGFSFYRNATFEENEIERAIKKVAMAYDGKTGIYLIEINPAKKEVAIKSLRTLHAICKSKTGCDRAEASNTINVELFYSLINSEKGSVVLKEFEKLLSLGEFQSVFFKNLNHTFTKFVVVSAIVNKNMIKLDRSSAEMLNGWIKYKGLLIGDSTVRSEPYFNSETD